MLHAAIGCPPCNSTGSLDYAGPGPHSSTGVCPLCKGTGETTDLAFENYDLRQQVETARVLVLGLTAELTFAREVMARLPENLRRDLKIEVAIWAAKREAA